jgi:glycosyltransferase involved in cell wall biosynthesis
MGNAKISCITPSFNQAAFLEETIASVLDQDYPNLEYIVIDGGSTDGSVEILRRHQHWLAYCVSEPDRGQVHAINKGLRRATGEIVAFLNSDDLYLPGTLKAVDEFFRLHPKCQWLCGDTILFEGRLDEGTRIPTVVPRSAAQCLSWAYKAPQPGMFWKAELVRNGFDERWNYCFDHELYIRLLLAGHQCEHLPRTVAGYRLHDRSKTVAQAKGFDHEFDAIAERYEAQLRGEGRRWCAATRWLRRSYQDSMNGRIAEATGFLLRALLLHPESIRQRPFWGCLRSVLRHSWFRTPSAGP